VFRLRHHLREQLELVVRDRQLKVHVFALISMDYSHLWWGPPWLEIGRILDKNKDLPSSTGYLPEFRAECRNKSNNLKKVTPPLPPRFEIKQLYSALKPVRYA
jgi:hypothetical protein